MRDILNTITKWWSDDETFGLATVVSTFRSAPRDPGAALAVRCGIFDDLAGFGVQLADHVRVHGRIPEVVIVIDADSVRGGHRSRQLEFLKGLGLGIEPREVPAKIIAEPDHAL